MTRRRTIVPLLAAALLTGSAAAGPVYPGGVASPIEIEQRLGAALAFELLFVDEDGRAVRLGDFFRDGVPVVLVLGYFHCPRLCETVAEGTIEALAESGVPRTAYRLLLVSVDPSETPADARARRLTDLAWADLAADRFSHGRGARPPLDLHALVGDSRAIDGIARQVGFKFVRRAAPDAQGEATPVFDHAAGFVIVTPSGRVSHYFLGVRHDPVALQRALEDARGDSIGAMVDRLVLLCAHLDPTLGRWSAATLLWLKLLGMAGAALLALWVWRHRRPPGAVESQR